jgi:hypothetical protein
MFYQDIVKSQILKLLGKSKKINSKDCVIKELNSEETIEFLEKNYLFNIKKYDINIGLMYNDEIVSIMIIEQIDENCYKILCLNDKLNLDVIGSYEDLFKYFIETYKPKEVVSYVDRTWHDGRIYDKLKFKFIEKTQPNCYYVIEGLKRDREKIYSKKNITEIYDSGYLKYVWKNN